MKQSRLLDSLDCLDVACVKLSEFLDVKHSRLVDNLECFKVACVKLFVYSIVRIEAEGSSKLWRPVYQTSPYHVSEYRNLQHEPTACHKKLLYVSGASLQLRTSRIIFHPQSSGKFPLINFFVSTSSLIIHFLSKLRK